jgi:hypothetical protein
MGVVMKVLHVILGLFLLIVLNGCSVNIPNNNGLPTLPDEKPFQVIILDSRSEFYDYELIPLSIDSISDKSVIIEKESAILLFLWVPAQNSWVKTDFRLEGNQNFPAVTSLNQSVILELSPQVKVNSETLKMRVIVFAKTQQGETTGNFADFSIKPMGSNPVQAFTIQGMVNASQKYAQKWQPDAYLARFMIEFPVKDGVSLPPFEINFFSANTNEIFSALMDITGNISYSFGTNQFGQTRPIIPGEWRIDIKEAVALLNQKNPRITWPAERRSWLFLERQQVGEPLTWYFYELESGQNKWRMQLKYTIDAVTGQITPVTGVPIYR